MDLTCGTCQQDIDDIHDVSISRTSIRKTVHNLKIRGAPIQGVPQSDL